MKLIRRGKLLGHDWYFRLGKRVTVTGVNSLTKSGNSLLFWEFDNKAVNEVWDALADIQEAYTLPNIYLLQASTPLSWHAVCLSAWPWLRALSIIAGTRYVDPDYVRLAAYREHFTLRLTDKGQGKPQLHSVIAAEQPEDCALDDLISGVRYGAWMR